MRAWSGGLTGQIIDQTTHWADEFALQERRQAPAAAPPPAPAQSEHTVPPELNPSAIEVWRLTCCKRFGDPLLSFIEALLPKVAKDLALMPDHPGTAFCTVYYHSECVEWWSMEGLLKHLTSNFLAMDDQRCHFLRHVVWNPAPTCDGGAVPQGRRRHRPDMVSVRLASDSARPTF